MNHKVANSTEANKTVRSVFDLSEKLNTESELESRFLKDPDFVKGLLWGLPRYGHPEGQVYKHINEVTLNIDRLDPDPETRSKLRFIAFVHDTFKYLEDKSSPRDWTKHHGAIARRFAQQYTDDASLLNIIELHDEAYYVWRMRHLYNKERESEIRLQKLLTILGDQLQLFYLFFKCDTMTGDKTPAPLLWFESYIPEITLADFRS